MTRKFLKITLGPEYFGANFSPTKLTSALKQQGFEFISETCPVQFAGKTERIKHDDGAVTFIQRLED